MPNQCNEFDLRPYRDEEVGPILAKLQEAPGLIGLIEQAFPQLDLLDVAELLRDIKTVEAFQSRLMAAGVDYLVKHTSDGLSVDGLDHLDKDRCYTFISNHRDISLDSALLARETHRHMKRTMEMAIGDNLVTSDWLSHLFKLNKTVIVRRGLTPRALLASSKRLSRYVFDLVGEGIDNFWIAQAEGRAKDGRDLTQSGVVKMLALAGKGEVLEVIRTLHPVPVSISYEYDPNDLAKAREILATTRHGEYDKAEDEDLRSILRGLKGYKGRIHLTISQPMDERCVSEGQTRNERLNLMVDTLDKSILKGYKLWPNNYLADDMLHNRVHCGEHYSQEDLDRFEAHLQERLNDLEDADALRPIILEMYANPLRLKRERDL